LFIFCSSLSRHQAQISILTSHIKNKHVQPFEWFSSQFSSAYIFLFHFSFTHW
jgi:hypothetical protein